MCALSLLYDMALFCTFLFFMLLNKFVVAAFLRKDPMYSIKSYKLNIPSIAYLVLKQNTHVAFFEYLEMNWDLVCCVPLFIDD